MLFPSRTYSTKARPPSTSVSNVPSCSLCFTLMSTARSLVPIRAIANLPGGFPSYHLVRAMKIRTQLVLACFLLSIVPLGAIVLYTHHTSRIALQSAYRSEAARATRQMDHRL